MQLIPEIKTFTVLKIKKVKDGYKLVFKNRKEPSVFISKAACASALDPFTSLFSIAHIIDLSYFGDLIVSISVDGLVVFQKKFEEYPQYYQDYWNKTTAQIEAENHAYDEALKTKLETYLENFKSVDILRIEDEILKLPADFRVYLGLHLYQASKVSLKRLELMLKVCQIAERIYKRHVKPYQWSKQINCCLSMYCLDYGYRVDIQKYTEDPEFATLFETYHEVETLINQALPPTDDKDVKRYLNYLIRSVLYTHAEDFAFIASHALMDKWGERRYSDLEEIEWHIDDMKMPFFPSLILPEVFSKEDVKGLLTCYNLF